MAKEHNVTANFSATSSMTCDAKVVRGQESWTYIRWALAIAIGFEVLIFGMVPLPWKLAALVAVPITAWQFLSNGWVHNKLLALKGKIESKPR